MRNEWKAECPITGSIITITEVQCGSPLPKTSSCEQKRSPSLGDSWMQRWFLDTTPNPEMISHRPNTPGFPANSQQLFQQPPHPLPCIGLVSACCWNKKSFLWTSCLLSLLACLSGCHVCRSFLFRRSSSQATFWVKPSLISYWVKICCVLFLFLKNIFGHFYWCMVVLQCCVSFCCAARWISRTQT